VDTVLGRLRLILLLLCAGGVGLAAVLGRLFANAVIAPIRRLTETAEHVSATEDLGRRIEAPGADEVGRLANRFNAMLDTLQSSRGALDASVRAQRQLVADASHELRTPVTALRTNIEVLLEGGELPVAERTVLLDEVRSQLEELSALIGDLIELARGDEPLSAVEDVRLDELVVEAVRRAGGHARDVRFVTELEPASVEGMRDRLSRAVNNLLDNAAKHSPPGGEVEVRVQGGEIAVRDHGPGVPETELEHLFDRFYRGSNSRGRAGTGLGLAIVRQVADAHGGSVSAHNAGGGGALFRLRLPLEPAS
jgi:two-component system sensor histidine kinase MprB